MAKITIDGREHDLETLSEEAKGQLRSLKYVESELARIQAQAAALQTARIAYARALKDTLETGKAEQNDDLVV